MCTTCTMVNPALFGTNNLIFGFFTMLGAINFYSFHNHNRSCQSAFGRQRTADRREPLFDLQSSVREQIET